jgi:hypothetical protein
MHRNTIVILALVLGLGCISAVLTHDRSNLRLQPEPLILAWQAGDLQWGNENH